MHKSPVDMNHEEILTSLLSLEQKKTKDESVKWMNALSKWLLSTPVNYDHIYRHGEAGAKKYSECKVKKDYKDDTDKIFREASRDKPEWKRHGLEARDEQVRLELAEFVRLKGTKLSKKTYEALGYDETKAKELSKVTATPTKKVHTPAPAPQKELPRPNLTPTSAVAPRSTSQPVVEVIEEEDSTTLASFEGSPIASSVESTPAHSNAPSEPVTPQNVAVSQSPLTLTGRLNEYASGLDESSVTLPSVKDDNNRQVVLDILKLQAPKGKLPAEHAVDLLSRWMLKNPLNMSEVLANDATQNVAYLAAFCRSGTGPITQMREFRGKEQTGWVAAGAMAYRARSRCEIFIHMLDDAKNMTVGTFQSLGYTQEDKSYIAKQVDDFFVQMIGLENDKLQKVAVLREFVRDLPLSEQDIDDLLVLTDTLHEKFGSNSDHPSSAEEIAELNELCAELVRLKELEIQKKASAVAAPVATDSPFDVSGITADFETSAQLEATEEKLKQAEARLTALEELVAQEAVAHEGAPIHVEEGSATPVTQSEQQIDAIQSLAVQPEAVVVVKATESPVTTVAATDTPSTITFNVDEAIADATADAHKRVADASTTPVAQPERPIDAVESPAVHAEAPAAPVVSAENQLEGISLDIRTDANPQAVQHVAAELKTAEVQQARVEEPAVVVTQEVVETAIKGVLADKADLAVERTEELKQATSEVTLASTVTAATDALAEKGDQAKEIIAELRQAASEVTLASTVTAATDALSEQGEKAKEKIAELRQAASEVTLASTVTAATDALSEQGEKAKEKIAELRQAASEVTVAGTVTAAKDALSEKGEKAKEKIAELRQAASEVTVAGTVTAATDALSEQGEKAKEKIAELRQAASEVTVAGTVTAATDALSEQGEKAKEKIAELRQAAAAVTVEGTKDAVTSKVEGGLAVVGSAVNKTKNFFGIQSSPPEKSEEEKTSFFSFRKKKAATSEKPVEDPKVPAAAEKEKKPLFSFGKKKADKSEKPVTGDKTTSVELTQLGSEAKSTLSTDAPHTDAVTQPGVVAEQRHAEEQSPPSDSTTHDVHTVAEAPKVPAAAEKEKKPLFSFGKKKADTSEKPVTTDKTTSVELTQLESEAKSTLSTDAPHTDAVTQPGVVAEQRHAEEQSPPSDSTTHDVHTVAEAPKVPAAAEKEKKPLFSFGKKKADTSEKPVTTDKTTSVELTQLESEAKSTLSTDAPHTDAVTQPGVVAEQRHAEEQSPPSDSTTHEVHTVVAEVDAVEPESVPPTLRDPLMVTSIYQLPQAPLVDATAARDLQILDESLAAANDISKEILAVLKDDAPPPAFPPLPKPLDTTATIMEVEVVSVSSLSAPREAVEGITASAPTAGENEGEVRKSPTVQRTAAATDSDASDKEADVHLAVAGAGMEALQEDDAPAPVDVSHLHIAPVHTEQPWVASTSPSADVLTAQPKSPRFGARRVHDQPAVTPVAETAAVEQPAKADVKQPLAVDTNKGKAEVKPLAADTNKGNGEVKPLAVDTNKGKAEVKPLAADTNKGNGEVKPLAADTNKGKAEVKPLAADTNKGNGEVKPLAADTNKGNGEVKPLAADTNKGKEEGKPVVQEPVQQLLDDQLLLDYLRLSTSNDPADQEAANRRSGDVHLAIDARKQLFVDVGNRLTSLKQLIKWIDLNKGQMKQLLEATDRPPEPRLMAMLYVLLPVNMKAIHKEVSPVWTHQTAKDFGGFEDADGKIHVGEYAELEAAYNAATKSHPDYKPLNLFLAKSPHAALWLEAIDAAHQTESYQARFANIFEFDALKLAAKKQVDAAVEGPKYVVKTNVLQSWNLKPASYQATFYAPRRAKPEIAGDKELIGYHGFIAELTDYAGGSHALGGKFINLFRGHANRQFAPHVREFLRLEAARPEDAIRTLADATGRFRAFLLNKGDLVEVNENGHKVERLNRHLNNPETKSALRGRMVFAVAQVEALEIEAPAVRTW